MPLYYGSRPIKAVYLGAVSITALMLAGAAVWTAAGPAGEPFTWDAANTSGDITISGGNAADVTTDEADFHKATRSTQILAAKEYIEWAVRGVSDASLFRVGLSNENNAGGGNLSGSEGFCYRADGDVESDFGTVATLDPYGSGATVCQATDRVNALVWWRVGADGDWNGNPSADPATGVGGLDFSGIVTANDTVFLAAAMRAVGDGVTVNTTGLVGAVPSGFTVGSIAA